MPCGFQEHCKLENHCAIVALASHRRSVIFEALHDSDQGFVSSLQAIFLTTSLSALQAAWRQQLALLQGPSSQAVNAAVNGAAMAAEWERSLVLLRRERE